MYLQFAKHLAVDGKKTKEKKTTTLDLTCNLVVSWRSNDILISTMLVID